MALLLVANVVALGALVRVGGAQDKLSKAQTVRVTAADMKYQRYLTRFDIRQFVLKGKPSDAAAEAKATADLDADIAAMAPMAATDAAVLALVTHLKALSDAINARNAFQVNAIKQNSDAMLLAFRGKPLVGLGTDVAKSLADNNVDIPKEVQALNDLEQLTITRVADAQTALNSIYRIGLIVAIVSAVVALIVGIVIVMTFGKFDRASLARVRGTPCSKLSPPTSPRSAERFAACRPAI